MTTDPAVTVRGVTKTYRSGSRTVPALQDVDLDVSPGELVVVRGRSGSGKTTLLNVVGGLDRADAGSVVVAGHDVTALDEDGLLRLRRETVGFVFQTFGLIPILSAAENVGVPLRLLGTDPDEREDRVRVLLAMVGLADHVDQRPGELSGGQQQRVAIARALANRPAVLLADEPTGQLDSHTGRAAMELLRAVVEAEGVAALVATHDPVLIEVADRVLDLRDGRLSGPAGSPPPPAAR